MGQMVQHTIGMVCGKKNRYFPNASRGEAHQWFRLGSVMVAKQMLHSKQVE
jgi:hypothetical protein